MTIIANIYIVHAEFWAVKVLTYLKLTKKAVGKYCYPYFTDEETEHRDL